MKERVRYYSDLRNDDFSETNIKATPLPDNYKYIHKNVLWRFFAGVVYYVVAKPILFSLTKIRYHQRFANKKLIKQAKHTGAFIYGNHTSKAADSFVPNILFPFKRNYIIVSPEAMSIKGIKTLLQQLGAIPLTDKMHLKKDFLRCIKKRIEQKSLITIFPEAHIWLFYNKIRPFSEVSFKYPVITNAPVYALTNCYQKRKFGKFPKVVTYLDGPFYPKEELSKDENAVYLRDLVYQAMVERSSKYSTYEYIKYIYQPKNSDASK